MASGKDWTTEELRASVEAYLDMLRHFRSGLPFVKKQYYRALASRFGRTEKAFEYRAQNISHVLALQGRDWLPGLVPAKNVGQKVTAQIEEILADAEGVPNSEEATFESQVQASRKRNSLVKPEGSERPRARVTECTTYERDADVKAWVLKQAKGECEACRLPAPFLTFDDEPFLEVHHVRHLADGGSDTVTNAVAICPNCHRAVHYSFDKLDRIYRLYESVSRLRRE